METMKPKNNLVSATKISEKVGVSHHTILRWARLRLIPSYRVGQVMIRFDPEETLKAILITVDSLDANEPNTEECESRPIK